MVKKRWLFYLFILFLLIIPVVAADPITDTLAKAGKTVLKLFDLSWVEGPEMLGALVRVGVFLMVFALLFWGSRTLHLPGATGGIIAFVMAAITAIFIPASILIAMGGIWATIFAMVFVFGPILAVLFIIYTYIPGTTWVQNLIRIIILLMLMFAYIMVMSNLPGGL